MTRFADLEEVRLRVRDPLVSQLFAEAVSAYDNNALRGATVTLWTAVVFDIVAKFRELELGGDKDAQAQLKKFETAEGWVGPNELLLTAARRRGLDGG